MPEYNEDAILEELDIFRWSLYNAKKDDEKEKENEKEKSLLEEACRKSIYEPFIEEWLIAGGDIKMLIGETKINVQEFVGEADLPSIRKKDDKFWDSNRLHICLAYGNEELFIKGLELIAEKNPTKMAQILSKSDDLFCAAALNNFSLAIDKLVEYDANVTEVALLCACKSASWKSLETLLKYCNLGENITPLLKELSSAWQNNTEPNREDFEKCYELLLKRSSTYVNYVDKSRHSVMYYVRNQSDKVSECLKMGAYIGMQNIDLRPDVAFITPKTLQTHFDSCIQLISCETDIGKKIEYIEFDYKNLIPSETCKDVAPNEMNAIEFMSNSEDHRHLLIHPLLFSFISLKWNQLALVYYMDFYLYLLFALLNSGCILTSFEKSSDYVKVPFIILTAMLTVYVAMRCILHLTFCSAKHQRSWANYMQCLQTSLIIIFVVLVLWGVLTEINRTIAAISVLLIALKLFILAGSIFWTFSKFYIMFLNVAWSSIKSLQLCIIFIPSFLMSYYLLIRDPLSKDEQHTKNLEDFKTDFFDYLYEIMHPDSNKVDPATLEEFKNKFFVLLPKLLEQTGENEEKASNEFLQTVSSLVKTIMTWHRKLGEQITSFDLNTLGIVVVLITLLSIIFMNLMNGLAVNDAKRIQSEAELTSLVQRVHLLARYEEALSNRKHWFRQKLQGTFIMELFEYFTQFESLEYMRQMYDRKIYVGQKNEIVHFIESDKIYATTQSKQQLSRQQSEYKSKDKGDIKLAIDMLYSRKNKSKIRMFSTDNEVDIGLEEPFMYGKGRIWKTLIRSFPFFDERERMNPQIETLARQIIEKRETDQKGKEEQNQYKEQIAKLQSNMEILLQKVDKVDTFDDVNCKILEKLTNIESKIVSRVD